MRMKEVTESVPKPLALIGGRPILWQIMKLYSRFDFCDFILPLGYMGEKIKEYFINCDWMQNDFILELSGKENKLFFLSKPEKWKITFVDTGSDTKTGGRIKRICRYIDGDTFFMTYGDGLCDVDIEKLLKYHREMGKIATLTGVEKKSQYGVLKVADGLATHFGEKTEIEGIINGGFFVLNKEVFDYLGDDQCVFEKDTLTRLASEGQLAVYEHKGFWQSVDTVKDLQHLNSNWKAVSGILGI